MPSEEKKLLNALWLNFQENVYDIAKWLFCWKRSEILSTVFNNELLVSPLIYVIQEDQLKKLEIEFELQEKIIEAELHLAQDKSLPKSVRKKHRRTYRQAYQKASD